jgi:hypothetical protein
MTRRFIQDCLNYEEDIICLGHLDTITKGVAQEDVDLRQLAIERLAHSCGWDLEMESNELPASIPLSVQPKHNCAIDYDRLYEHRDGHKVIQPISTEKPSEIISIETTIPKIIL